MEKQMGLQLPLCPLWLQWSARADLISYSEWQRCGPWMPPVVLTATTQARPRLTQLPTLAVCLSNVMTHGFF